MNFRNISDFPISSVSLTEELLLVITPNFILKLLLYAFISSMFISSSLHCCVVFLLLLLLLCCVFPAPALHFGSGQPGSQSTVGCVVLLTYEFWLTER